MSRANAKSGQVPDLDGILSNAPSTSQDYDPLILGFWKLTSLEQWEAKIMEQAEARRLAIMEVNFLAEIVIKLVNLPKHPRQSWQPVLLRYSSAYASQDQRPSRTTEDRC